MKMTEMLKTWLAENCDVAADASDEDMKAAATGAIADGTLTPEKLVELTTEKAVEDDEDDLSKMIQDTVAKAVADQMAKQTPGLTTDDVAGAIDKALENAKTKAQDDTDAKAAALFGGDGDEDKGTRVRVKAAAEQYSTTKSALFHAEDAKHFPGEPAMYANRQLETTSQLEKAVIGATFKSHLAASGRPLPRGLRMTDHDRDLMAYAMREMPWSGIIHGEGTEDLGAIKVDGRKLSDFEIKALLDDSDSGGQEAVPEVFDTAIITTPVLHGELFPLVNTVPIGRGSSVDGFSIGNPTFANTAEGSAITPFTTDGMIEGFDTTIYPAVGALEIGNDFEEDSTVSIGATIIERYGEKAMEWLDNQIANGDGTTEPKGVLNAPAGQSFTAITRAAAGAAPTVDDYESLLFSIAKQFRPASDRARTVFLSNDTTYQRARSIQVGAADERRVFNMTHTDYMLFGYPYKVQNDIGNQSCGFFNLKHYRMYRRLGLSVRIETGGRALALANKSLIVVRMRFGGKIEQSGAGSYSTEMQA